MSRPRMFVSSTYYDLKYVRADIEEFGQQFGLDTVLFEKGEIPYESDKELEESCYRAVEHSDLVVSIIGGRAGTKAKTNPEATISQMEVRTAHKLGKQMLFFVDRNVSVEYEIWAKNDRNKDVVWAFTEGAAVFRFIHEIRNLKLNNAMFTFETSQDIICLLREQLAGLFQAMLQRKARTQYESHVDDLVGATKALKDIVNFLETEKIASQGIVREILFTRHPLFKKLQVVLQVDARLFFESLDEAERLLRYFGYQRIPEQELNQETNESFVFWVGKKNESKTLYVGLTRDLFDDQGRLKPMALDEWREEYISTNPKDAVAHSAA